MEDKMARLLYLASLLREPIPPQILKWIPFRDVIKAVTEGGLAGASVELSLSSDQLDHLFERGGELGPPSRKEFRSLVSAVVLEELKLKEEDLPMSEWLKEVGALSAYLQTAGDSLIEYDRVDLTDVEHEKVVLEKWSSGLEPIDLVLGGFYQALMVILARPGTGKTTLMLMLMEALRQNKKASEIWFYQAEIPARLLLYRMKPILKRTEFAPGDQLVCGFKPVREIINEVEAAPDPERVIFYDAPDILVSTQGDSRRFGLEELYQDLVRLKQLVKLVVVSSQPRRRDRVIQLESGAEAWSKAWYADIFLGLNTTPITDRRRSLVKLNVPKNRFGPPQRELSFWLNYQELTWELTKTGSNWTDWDEAPSREEEDW